MIRFAIALLLVVPGCFPGHCDGAIRGVNEGAPGAFWLNVDTGAKTDEDLFAASKVSTTNVFLSGVGGQLTVVLAAHVNPSAHSCASAGSIHIDPAAPLPAGDYSLVVLLDQVAFPALDDDEVGSWQGHRAIVHRFHVP